MFSGSTTTTISVNDDVTDDTVGCGDEPLEGRDEPVDGSVAARVLASVREHRRVADAAEAALLADVLAWCRLHTTDDPQEAATWGDTPVLVGGEGCPWVSEFTVTELATALRLSPTGGRGLVADVVELAYRLPRLWGRVQAGLVPAWRARRVAQRTSGLSVAAAGFVDAQVVGHAARIGVGALDRLVETALARYQPELAAAQRRAGADGRRFDVHHDQVSLSGTSWVEGQLELADALDLDAAIGQVATQLKELGCGLGLDQRRALAAGQIARTQLALNLHTDPTTSAATGQPAEPPAASRAASRADRAGPGGGPGERAGRRDLTLYAHLSADALTAMTGLTGLPGPTGGTVGTAAGAVDADAVVSIEGHGTRLVTLDTVRDWLSVNAAVRVTIRPVLDLNANLVSPGRFPTATHREQVTLRDRSCVAPHCQRPARHLDLDHIHPWPNPGTGPRREPDDPDEREPAGREPPHDPAGREPGRDPTRGSTSSSNLAVLCRHHHRAKTFTDWDYEQLLPGVFLWKSPHGLRYLTYPGHTIDLN